MADERAGLAMVAAEEASRWLAAVPNRRARRSYTGDCVADTDLDELEGLAASWQPWYGARATLIRQAPPSVFMGVIGSYGGISGSPSALAFLGDKAGPPEAVGYTGEGLVLAATARGLETCWVAGVFSAAVAGRLASLHSCERIFAVSALGHAPAGASIKERILFKAGRPKMRRSHQEIAVGYEAWPTWAQAAVSAARVAPSAMNRQPWRFAFSDGALTVSINGPELPKVSKRLDCGIAMLHAELGAFGEGVTGTWRLLESPAVAVFTPDAT